MNIQDLYPQSPTNPSSLADAPPVITNVAGNVVNPQGNSVLDIGNDGYSVTDTISSTDFQNQTIDGTNRLLYTNQNLANNVRVGDTVVVGLTDENGVTVAHTVTVKDVNSFTGEVTFNEADPSLTNLSNASSISVQAVSSEATFNGRALVATRADAADTIARFTSDSDTTPEDTRVVYLTDTAYNAIGTKNADTLYLIYKA